MRLDQLYANDAQLHALWSSALEARGMAGGMSGSSNRQEATALGRMAAGFLATSSSSVREERLSPGLCLQICPLETANVFCMLQRQTDRIEPLEQHESPQ